MSQSALHLALSVLGASILGVVATRALFSKSPEQLLRARHEQASRAGQIRVCRSISRAAWREAVKRGDHDAAEFWRMQMRIDGGEIR